MTFPSVKDIVKNMYHIFLEFRSKGIGNDNNRLTLKQPDKYKQSNANN